MWFGKRLCYGMSAMEAEDALRRAKHNLKRAQDAVKSLQTEYRTAVEKAGSNPAYREVAERAKRELAEARRNVATFQAHVRDLS